MEEAIAALLGIGLVVYCRQELQHNQKKQQAHLNQFSPTKVEEAHSFLECELITGRFSDKFGLLEAAT
jgi:hypothetical protein